MRRSLLTGPAILSTIALLGCGSAGTFDDPSTEQRPSSTSSAPPCVEPDPAVAGRDAACGVFVSSSLGSDDNEGTLEHPVRTLGKAFALALEGYWSVDQSVLVLGPVGTGRWTSRYWCSDR